MAVKINNHRRSASSLLFRTALFIGLTIAFTIIIPLLIVLSPFLLAGTTVNALTEIAENRKDNSRYNESDKNQWNEFVNSMNKWSNEL